MSPNAVPLSARKIDLLRGQFKSLPDVSTFQANPKLASQVASYGIAREVGTPNDELARFIFDAESQLPVRRESLKAGLVEWNGFLGVHICSTDSQRLDLRTKGFYDFVHPKLSANADGTFHSLYIFPEIVARIAAMEGLELVMVREWGMNSIFGGFDPRKGYYQTNFWEIENNDVLKFADLTRQGRIAFMGTHDLIAHIAGVDRSHWPMLKKNAQRVYDGIQNYFYKIKNPSISALVLPYAIGVVLDDLAQPPSYSSPGHIAVLDELLLRIEQRAIPPELRSILTRFPPSFQKVIELSRTPGIHSQPQRIKDAVQAMITEILAASVVSVA